ncbi:MAG: lysophospholipase [Leptolyngbyaceae cyanobacterium RU_5_1]|nr:lysophospholipase [Leptolyngbyaceae cyanobacterium RU_5_1]
MTDPLFFALAQESLNSDQVALKLETQAQHSQAVQAEKERLNRLLLQMRSNVRPESGTSSTEFSQSMAHLPKSGSQLYSQRLAALRAGQIHSQMPAHSFRASWIRASRQPTYEQWRTLLAWEAAVVARGQSDRLGVMLGDSLSLWFPSDRLPQTRIWLNQSISGETTSHILQRLSDFSVTQPRVIYIMAGINDLKHGASDARILWNFRQILSRLRHSHPQTQIVIQSILPTRTVALSRVRIGQLNQQLAAIAQQNGAFYLDVYSHMADKDGYLRADLTTDGLHLNARGYAAWQVVLKQAELQIARG